MMPSLLNSQLGEFTLAWFLISVVCGGVLGAVIKYVFETMLPERLRHYRDMDKIVQRFSYPILLACNDAEQRIETMMVRGVKSNWLSEDVIYELKKGKGFLGD